MALLEEVHSSLEAGSRASSVTLFSVLSLCFVFAVKDVVSQLPSPVTMEPALKCPLHSPQHLQQ